MIRLNVTALESYRYWKAKEDSTLAELVEELTRQGRVTPQMEAGGALAELFETATHRSVDVWEGRDGWTFRFDIEKEISIPTFRELKAEVVFETPSGPVLLVGKVDGLEGLTVHDQKLTEKFDAERYFDSLQWRSYLVMFKATEFVYDVFVGKYDNKDVTIREYHRLPFYTYPNIREDVERAVCELAEIITRYAIPVRRTSFDLNERMNQWNV